MGRLDLTSGSLEKQKQNFVFYCLQIPIHGVAILPMNHCGKPVLGVTQFKIRNVCNITFSSISTYGSKRQEEEKKTVKVIGKSKMIV